MICYRLSTFFLPSDNSKSYKNEDADENEDYGYGACVREAEGVKSVKNKYRGSHRIVRDYNYCPEFTHPSGKHQNKP